MFWLRELCHDFKAISDLWDAFEKIRDTSGVLVDGVVKLISGGRNASGAGCGSLALCSLRGSMTAMKSFPEG